MKYRMELSGSGGMPLQLSLSSLAGVPALADKKWQNAALIKDWELPLRF
jgi:hypothetical protein